MHILHIEPQRYNAEVRSRLETVGSVDFLDLHTHAELVKQISSKPYQALFVKLGIPIDKAILDAAPNLQFIVTPTTGLNHIDQEAAAERGITVHSLKGEYEFLANIKSTSEHTWMLLMALVRRLPQAFSDVKQYHWRREPFLGMELNGKTLGVIGYGRLGRIVAQYGQAFTMRVLVNDTDPQQLENLPEGLEAVDLETLSRESDIVTLHIPSNEENYHFLNTEKLQALKPGVVLVNTSRGEVLEESALLQALQSGHLRGAAIDVIEGDSSWEQGVPEDHPLLEYAKMHENLLITPHIGGYALESIEGTRAFVTDKFIHSLSTK